MYAMHKKAHIQIVQYCTQFHSRVTEHIKDWRMNSFLIVERVDTWSWKKYLVDIVGTIQLLRKL